MHLYIYYISFDVKGGESPRGSGVQGFRGEWRSPEGIGGSNLTIFESDRKIDNFNSVQLTIFGSTGNGENC